MIELITGVLSDFWKEIVGGIAAIGAAFLVRQSGKKSERLKNAENTLERQEAGRKARDAGRDSGKSPADRLRDNDGKWRQ